jgi:succinate dehydrogenase/fumarate reductase cytochrome b subunit
MMDESTKQVGAPITGGPNERIGLVGWLSLYVSGAILFVLLLTHVLAIHFMRTGEITAATVRQDVGSSFLSVIILGLLLVGLFHGLLGFFRMSLDLEILGARGSRRLRWVLCVTGAGLTVLGVVVFSCLSF